MSVTVLCPNGHRVTIKTTPNTSILQIIEDACKKYDFNPDLYELKHLRRRLDASSTVRYTNLPNNSQLELIKASTPRVASNVSVHINTEAGQRLAHDFPSTTNLWDILKHFQDGAEQVLLPLPDEQVTLVYTMRRISGPDLHTVTLKSLGLTKGKCMFRHSIQALSQSSAAASARSGESSSLPQPSSGAVRKGTLHTVQRSLPDPPQEVDALSFPDVAKRIPKTNEPDSTNQPPEPIVNPSGAALPQENMNDSVSCQPVVSPSLPDLGINDGQVLRPGDAQSNDGAMSNFTGRPNLIPDEGPDIVSSSQSPGIPDLVQSQSHFEPPDIVGDMSSIPMDLVANDAGVTSAPLAPTLEDPVAVVTPSQSQEDMDVDSSQPLQQEALPSQDQVILIGDHDAILFSLDDAPPVLHQDEDDSFFELSVNEVKKIYSEYQSVLKELEEQPLKTKGMREMEKQAKMLAALNQFPVVQLRICFPDNHVIQVSFKPHDTIKMVMEFISQFLVQTDLKFSLHNNYPRRELQPHSSLVEADCIPKARLYFHSEESLPVYINEATLALKSTYSSANSAIIKSNRKPHKVSTTISAPTISHELYNIQENVTATSGARPRQVQGAKKPKWFKLGK